MTIDKDMQTVSIHHYMIHVVCTLSVSVCLSVCLSLSLSLSLSHTHTHTHLCLQVHMFIMHGAGTFCADSAESFTTEVVCAEWAGCFGAVVKLA